METTQLKNYAPAARKAFIAAVKAQAAKVGLTAKETLAVKVEGDVLLVAGRAFPKAVAPARRRLTERVRAQGFEPTMEAIAYTWFNRFAAIRYMELHGYLDHGYRVLSHPEGRGRPEILDHAADVDLPGLDRAKAVELKLEGTKDEELYRLLLRAQCDALHRAMPFIFDPIGNETELLLPANLLHSDSLVRQMVESIDEDLWQDIEIIGWLYQFYISERKDEVIGKVVKSEDIPAATQLFTPNWVVKYMVQNSLGAQWLATYPHSPLRSQMEFYIDPAEQTDEVTAQLSAITPSTLHPEELTLVDPACGSGHILVEAYDIFRAIYLERGHRRRDVAKLILEKNLFGLDIDERAAQLSGFALMMKGRADDRRLFGRGVRLNVVTLATSAGFETENLAKGVKLANYGLTLEDLAQIKRLFDDATTLGSLIQVPDGLVEKLPALRKLCSLVSTDLFVSDALRRLSHLVLQADVLARQYDTVVANPPYMGSKYMNATVKRFAKAKFPKSSADLFSVSAERFPKFAKHAGFVALMTPFTWMFLRTYEPLRKLLTQSCSLQSLIQPEYHAFFESAYVPICTFVLRAARTPGCTASFIRLTEFYGADLQPKRTLEAIADRNCGWFYQARPDDFEKIPGGPIAYWVSPRVRQVFSEYPLLHEVAKATGGMTTGNNDRFLRLWPEIDFGCMGRGITDRESAMRSSKKWFPYNKGGAFRKWFGNNDYVVNWLNDGEAIIKSGRAYPRSKDYYFKQSISWSATSSSYFGVRHSDAGFLFDAKGSSCFAKADQHAGLLALLVTKQVKFFLGFLNPTIEYQTGDIGNLPIPLRALSDTRITKGAAKAIELARADWNAYERSWDFQSLPLLTTSAVPAATVESSYSEWTSQNRAIVSELKELEENNNRLFIDAYGLADELTPDVPIEQITLTVNPAYRYGGKLTEEEQWTRFRQDTMEELVSYAIGCMMGRYSLDAPGLIYAHSGNEGFDPSQHTTFPADDDGIVPVTDTAWFDDDASRRFVEFVSVAWDAERLEENLTFVADNLGPKRGESSRDTIRRWLSDKFFKDHHLRRYKKRPIYWLFSSGKQKAFQCLLYLQRYNEGTLARMRSEYVIPLQGKMAARIEKLQGDIQVATSTAHSKRLEKELAKLKKQQVELLAFDEKLRHYADRRISLDLDDGVKVNYGMFGDLLAEVKAVHGKKPEVS